MCPKNREGIVTSKVLRVLAIACASSVVGLAQGTSSAPKPKVPVVTVVGCANRAADSTWQLTRATAATEVRQGYFTTSEIEAAKKQPYGIERYRLVGTAEFVTKEELLKTQQRGEFTRPEVANATGALQTGRKVAVKGLLITTSGGRTLNLLAVQNLDDACK